MKIYALRLHLKDPIMEAVYTSGSSFHKLGASKAKLKLNA